MGLYNIVFGMNKASDAILATLGLTRSDCGRFRDCFISEGRIAVYTRNGGGNRDCWHTDGGWYANERCKHESRVATVPEHVEATEEEFKQHPEWKPLNVSFGAKRLYETGRMVEERQFRCLSPRSADCSCPGCTIQYRLRKHPNYITDRDDDFDSTYATIYFSFPETFRDELARLDRGEKFDPSKRWLDAIEAIKQSTAWQQP